MTYRTYIFLLVFMPPIPICQQLSVHKPHNSILQPTVIATGLTRVTATAVDEAGNVASLVNTVVGKILPGNCSQNFSNPL